MVAQLNRLKINSCILDAGAIYEWDLRNRGLNRGFGFKIFRKTHLPIYGTNLDGEHWGRCGWYGDYPGSWWQIGIKLTLMPAIIQRTCSQLQMHKDKHNYIRERLLVADRKELILAGIIRSIISPSNYITADILNFNLADTNLGYLVGGRGPLHWLVWSISKGTWGWDGGL